MKKILSLVLVLAMVLSSFSFAFAASDDLTGHENEVAVRRLISLGLVKGDTQGYRPDDTITRAEFAAMAVRALGKEKVAEISKGATVFTDVPAAHWASGYIKVASTLGLVNGYGNGQFGPTDQITYEQALAIIVRALGYEQPALDKGGYPIGHLVVADDLDLTDLADGVSGMPATRGLVFQVIDNALIVDMMVQVGYGDEAKYEVKEGKTLLGELGYKSVTNRVVGFDVDDSEITIENVKGAVEVPEGFDFEAVYGLKITAWLDGDELVIYEVKDTPKFDATTGAAKIKLVGENKSYVVAEDATLILNGNDDVKAADFEADYAKVVLDADNEIVWAEGYELEAMVVEEVEDDIVYSYGDELDVEDYTIVKEGKTITVDDVEEGDILFVNEKNDFAVVYNNSEIGELDRIYSNSFKFEGAVYDNNNAFYLDGEALGNIDEEILDAMKDEGDIEVFFNFAGDVVLVMGDTGEEEVDYFYAVVTDQTEVYEEKVRTERELHVTFDILNSDGEVVTNDLPASFAAEYGDEDAKVLSDTTTTDEMFNAWKNDIKPNTGVKVTVNADGVIKGVEVLHPVSADGVEVDATYVKGYKLQDSAIVFLAGSDATKYDKYTVLDWADAADEFSEVTTGKVFVADNGRVVAMLVTATPEAKTTTHVGLVTNVRKLKSGVYEVTIEIAGDEFVYLTTDKDDITGMKKAVVEIELTDADEIEEIAKYTESALNRTIDTVSTSKDTITVTEGTYKAYELVENAVIYDKDLSEIKLRDLEKNDKIDVYFVDAETTRFVSYVIRTDVAPVNGGTTTPVDGEATVKYEFTVNEDNDSNIYLVVGDSMKIYNVLSTAKIVDKDGKDLVAGDIIAKDEEINYEIVEGTNNIAFIEVLN